MKAFKKSSLQDSEMLGVKGGRQQPIVLLSCRKKKLHFLILSQRCIFLSTKYLQLSIKFLIQEQIVHVEYFEIPEIS